MCLLPLTAGALPTRAEPQSCPAAPWPFRRLCSSRPTRHASAEAATGPRHLAAVSRRTAALRTPHPARHREERRGVRATRLTIRDVPASSRSERRTRAPSGASTTRSRKCSPASIPMRRCRRTQGVGSARCDTVRPGPGSIAGRQRHHGEARRDVTSSTSARQEGACERFPRQLAASTVRKTRSRWSSRTAVADSGLRCPTRMLVPSPADIASRPAAVNRASTPGCSRSAS